VFASREITEYTECQAFYPVVRIGSPRPLTRKRVLPHPLTWFVPAAGGHTRLRERGRREPIRTKGQILWYSRYRTIPLRVTSFLALKEMKKRIFVKLFLLLSISDLKGQSVVPVVDTVAEDALKGALFRVVEGTRTRREAIRVHF
jgi:hypothetical protein